MLTIDSEKKMSKTAQDEMTSIIHNARKLIKKPDMKLKNIRGMIIKFTIWTAVFLVFFIGCLILFGPHILLYIGLGMEFCLILTLVIFCISVGSTKKALAESTGTCTLTLSGEGLKYDDHENRKFELGWGAFSAVRVFEESVVFLPKQITGLLIRISSEHAQAVEEFMKQNQIPVPLITRSAADKT